METITITFGDVCENHVGNQQLGTLRDEGFTIEDLEAFQRRFERRGLTCELHRLDSNPEFFPASILIIRKGVDLFVESEDLFEELKSLDWDKKAKMRGRVVNKKARHNLCFADEAQDANYEEGKGTVIAFSDVHLLDHIRQNLSKILKTKGEGLYAEGNHYYDVNKTYIGFHGDSERKIVVALRLGASFPLIYQWYFRSEPVGKRFVFELEHGDMYVMSEKAVGRDWKKRSQYTLRHGAGFNL